MLRIWLRWDHNLVKNTFRQSIAISCESTLRLLILMLIISFITLQEARETLKNSHVQQNEMLFICFKKTTHPLSATVQFNCIMIKKVLTNLKLNLLSLPRKILTKSHSILRGSTLLSLLHKREFKIRHSSQKSA